MVFAQEQTAALQPVASWDVNALGKGAQSYCAMSRAYQEGLILTLGQNQGKEYSLAIDFQDARLNTSQSYKVTLQPGPGQVRAYQLRAASQRALVVRIGNDSSFFDALKQSKNLKAQINSQSYSFDLSDFDQGHSKLNNCMAGLGDTSTQMASNVDVPKPEKIDAEKTQAPIIPSKTEEKTLETPEPKIVERVVAAPAPEIEKVVTEAPEKAVPIASASAPVKLKKPSEAEAQKEKAEAAANVAATKVSKYKPVDLSRSDAEPLKSRSNIVSRQSVSSEIDTASNVPKPSILTERPELPAEKPKAIPQQKPARAIPKPEVIASKIVEAPEPVVEKTAPPAPEPIVQKEKPTAEKPASEKPDAQVASVGKTVSPRQPVDVKRTTDSQPRVWNNTMEKRQQDEIERIKAENKRLNEALRTQIKNSLASAPSAAKEDNSQVSELREQIAKLEAELAKKSNTDDFVSPEMQAEIKMLREQNKNLVRSLKSQETKMDSFDAKSPNASAELEKMREEVALLKQQNERLSKEAMKANNQIDGARMDAGTTALEKIKDYEKRLAAAREDNLALSREIEAMKNRKDEVTLAAASGDWDLEKATRRFNEAEREINRLGMLLEQQRAAHREEKAQLEQMLFDPAVTETQQRRRLVELEAKLLAAERQLEAMGKSRPQDRYDGSLARLETAPRQQPVQEQGARMQQVSPERRYETPFPNVAVPVSPVASESIASPAQNMRQIPRPPEVQDKRVSVNNASADIRSTLEVPDRTQSVAPVRSTVKMADVEQLLRQSGVQPTNMRQGTNGQYEWRAGNVTGVAEVPPKSQHRDVNQFLQDYISKARNACSGDFASSEATTSNSRTRSYDLVCLGNSQNIASSVVFTEKNGTLMAITHSANTDNLDVAIDLRDRVANKL